MAETLTLSADELSQQNYAQVFQSLCSRKPRPSDGGRREFPEDFRSDVVLLSHLAKECGKPVSEVLKDLDLHWGTLGQWREKIGGKRTATLLQDFCERTRGESSDAADGLDAMRAELAELEGEEAQSGTATAAASAPEGRGRSKGRGRRAAAEVAREGAAARAELLRSQTPEKLIGTTRISVRKALELRGKVAEDGEFLERPLVEKADGLYLKDVYGKDVKIS